MGLTCMECGISVWKTWKHCPSCGKVLKMTSSAKYLMYMHDAAQLNRVETMLKAIMKTMGISKPSDVDIGDWDKDKEEECDGQTKNG